MKSYFAKTIFFRCYIEASEPLAIFFLLLKLILHSLIVFILITFLFVIKYFSAKRTWIIEQYTHIHTEFSTKISVWFSVLLQLGFVVLLFVGFFFFFKLKAFNNECGWSARWHINLLTNSKIPIQSYGYCKPGSFSKPSCFSEKMFNVCTVNLRYPEETEIIACQCRSAVIKLNQMLQLFFGFGRWNYTSLFICIINSFLYLAMDEFHPMLN